MPCKRASRLLKHISASLSWQKIANTMKITAGAAQLAVSIMIAPSNE